VLVVVVLVDVEVVVGVVTNHGAPHLRGRKDELEFVSYRYRTVSPMEADVLAAATASKVTFATLTSPVERLGCWSGSSKRWSFGHARVRRRRARELRRVSSCDGSDRHDVRIVGEGDSVRASAVVHFPLAQVQPIPQSTAAVHVAATSTVTAIVN